MTHTHDDLVTSLAAHLRGCKNVLTWEDMQLGPSGTVRPDVFTMEKTFMALRTTAYECKASRADAARDFADDKWTRYRKYARTVVLAMPAGLLKMDEIPAGMGVMVLHPSGWKMQRRGVPTEKVEFPVQAWQKLLFDGIERQLRHPRPKAASEWHAIRAATKRIGRDLADKIAHANDLDSVIAMRRESIDAMDKRLAEARAILERKQIEAGTSSALAHIVARYREESGKDQADLLDALAWATDIVARARAAVTAMDTLRRVTS